MAENSHVAQCRGCGTLVERIRLRGGRTVECQLTPVLIHQNPRGRAIGYVRDGRIIIGDRSTPKEGGYECFLKHRCEGTE